MPLIVRAAWKEMSTPKVKKKLSKRAQLATMPGIRP